MLLLTVTQCIDKEGLKHSYSSQALIRCLVLLLMMAFLGASFSDAYAAPQGNLKTVCTLLIDAETGKSIYEKGDCDQRRAPAATFKVPLAVMGYDAGVLLDSMNPLWDMPNAIPGEPIKTQMATPLIWQKHSVLWYSRQLTLLLGQDRLDAYIQVFKYGNGDASSGAQGTPGIFSAWLGGTLSVSPREQVEFLRRLVTIDLPVSSAAQHAAMSIVPRYLSAKGVVVKGKTGSTHTYSNSWLPTTVEPIGWFVGWAKVGSQTIVFARLVVENRPNRVPLGLVARMQFLDDFDELMLSKE